MNLGRFHQIIRWEAAFFMGEEMPLHIRCLNAGLPRHFAPFLRRPKNFFTFFIFFVKFSNFLYIG